MHICMGMSRKKKKKQKRRKHGSKPVLFIAQGHELFVAFFSPVLAVSGNESV